MAQKINTLALKQIKQTLKRVTDHEIRERLLMVQASYKEPLRDAAKTFGCVHGKIAYWRKRYDVQGLRGLHTKEHTGRPSKLSKDVAAKIKRKVRRHDIRRGWRTKTIKEIIRQEGGVTYCERQVIRISQKWGLTQQKPRPKYAYAKKEDKDAFIKKTEPV